MNVAFGRAVSILEVSRAISDACGRADIVPEFRAPRPGDVIALHASVERCCDLLGVKPEIELRDGLTRYLNWLRDTMNDFATLLDEEQINWQQL